MSLEFPLVGVGGQKEVILRPQVAGCLLMSVSAAVAWLVVDSWIGAVVIFAIGAFGQLWTVAVLWMLWPRKLVVTLDELQAVARLRTVRFNWARVGVIRESTFGEVTRGRPGEQLPRLLRIDLTRPVVEMTLIDKPGRPLVLEPEDPAGFVAAAAPYVTTQTS